MSIKFPSKLKKKIICIFLVQLLFWNISKYIDLFLNHYVKKKLSSLKSELFVNLSGERVFVYFIIYLWWKVLKWQPKFSIGNLVLNSAILNLIFRLYWISWKYKMVHIELRQFWRSRQTLLPVSQRVG